MEERCGWVTLRVEFGFLSLGVARGEKDGRLGGVRVAFGVCVRVAIQFFLKDEGKVQRGDGARQEAGGEFFLLLSRFGLDSSGGRGGAWGSGGTTCVARCEERAATREDKSLRDPSRLDVAGGEGVAERSSWA